MGPHRCNGPCHHAWAAYIGGYTQGHHLSQSSHSGKLGETRPSKAVPAAANVGIPDIESLGNGHLTALVKPEAYVMIEVVSTRLEQ